LKLKVWDLFSNFATEKRSASPIWSPLHIHGTLAIIMKKLLFKILLAFTIVFFNSCKKSGKNSTEIQKRDLITKNIDSITNVLEIVYVDDQDLRQEYQKIEKEFGWDS
jgi:acyl-[acyl carrier protein]--UDP-N-acetylglucosamine O-acyltransferase